MKSYEQFCGVAAALDVIGERWTLLILRDLLFGPRRYNDLLAALKGITTNLLAKRLQHLEQQELIERTSKGYALTDRGLATKPIILALAEFGTDRLTFPAPPTLRSDPRWLVLNLHRRFRGGWIGQIDLVFNALGITLSSDGNALSMQTGLESETRLHAKGPGISRWILMGAALPPLIAHGSVGLEGPRQPAIDFDESLLPVT